jgi:hypothetical protein
LTRPTWPKILETHSIGFLLLVAFLLRLVILPLFYDDYNYWAFGVFTSFFLRGQNPYHIVSQDPTLLLINVWRYPPLYLLFTGPALLAKQLTGQTLVYLAALKAPFAVADLVSTFYLFKILSRSLPRNTSLKFAAFFAFNPVVIFESSGGGFNDSIPIALTVASFYYFLKAKDNDRQGEDLSKSALLLGLGIAVKIYPLLLIPFFVRGLKRTRERAYFALLSFLPALAVSIPYIYWDWHSYLDILAIRNVGGQHPLFPGLQFSGFVAIPVGTALVVSLAYVYLRKLPMISGIVLLFLWVNLAVFAQSFNYMVWGAPFFTIFVAQYRKLFWMPISPIITMLVALLFQGAFNQVGGSTGIFYWTFHLFRLQVVPFRGLAFDVLVLTGLLVSEGVAAYYFLSVARFQLKAHHTELALSPQIMRRILTGLQRNRTTLSIALCLLTIFSWSVVAAYANFEPHQYPVVEGTSFRFTENFHSSVLDYQWVFERNGTYSLDPSNGTISIVDAPDATAHIFRGWAGVDDGFHASNSAQATFLFKFDGFLPNSTGMTIANMTDGLLVVQQKTTTNFLYIDEASNNNATLTKADNMWHNFTIEYAPSGRTIMLDSGKLTRPIGTFARLMLGNTDSRKGFGGRTEFSSVVVRVNNFPTGYQSQFFVALALGAPLFLIGLVLASFSRRVRTTIGNLRQRQLATS